MSGGTLTASSGAILTVKTQTTPDISTYLSYDALSSSNSSNLVSIVLRPDDKAVEIVSNRYENPGVCTLTGLAAPTSDLDATNKKYVDDKYTITTQTNRFPQRTVRASQNYTGTATLSATVPLNKFVGVYPTALNTGLIFSYYLSVDSSNIVQAINVAVYNVTSVDITAIVSFVIQYYI